MTALRSFPSDVSLAAAGPPDAPAAQGWETYRRLGMGRKAARVAIPASLSSCFISCLDLCGR